VEKAMHLPQTDSHRGNADVTMRSMPPKGPCVYCRVEIAVEREHVFPASWYPNNTPKTVQRLTVPSCRACNERWKGIEESVGHDLLMVFDPDHPDADGVLDSIMRGWDPGSTTDQREAERRSGRANAILKTTVWAKPHDRAPPLPVQLPDGSVALSSPAREIDSRALNDLAEKFIRGVYFRESKGDLISSERGTTASRRTWSSKRLEVANAESPLRPTFVISTEIKKK
jgi:hypothetical protein